MKNFTLSLFLILIIQLSAKSQVPTQTVRGVVFDAESNVPLIGATIAILETNPLQGTATDAIGRFKISEVQVGRYNILVSYIGYNPYVASEVVVGSGKEVVLNIGLKESVNELQQVMVKAFSNKNEPINSMATLSAKQINMEEANRYAGGFDDPARLVSSLAGVASTIGNNGIVIRGNSPKGLLWRMEGVQIPNPNHFADYISLGGGAVTALSSQTMATSDFFTGAFPAEYGNALSGVFDINLRTGNTEKREQVFQAGLVGIDYSAEGPFKKEGRSSYLFNYRYSTLGLLAPILPKEMGKLTYQDLSFKLNFPTKAGIFSVWGIGAYDFQGKKALKDSTKWENSDNRKSFETRLTMGAIGLNYKKIIGTNTYLQTSLAATESSLDWMQKRYGEEMDLQPKRSIKDYKKKFTFSGLLNHKFNARHTNKTGFNVDRLMYDIDIRNAEDYGEPVKTYASEKNGSY
ncbi:MAG: carboxypeptidase-like regulatory domain-containing protein, partial [Bacteroidota bacterium]